MAQRTSKFAVTRATLDNARYSAAEYILLLPSIDTIKNWSIREFGKSKFTDLYRIYRSYVRVLLVFVNRYWNYSPRNSSSICCTSSWTKDRLTNHSCDIKQEIYRMSAVWCRPGLKLNRSRSVEYGKECCCVERKTDACKRYVKTRTGELTKVRQRGHYRLRNVSMTQCRAWIINETWS